MLISSWFKGAVAVASLTCFAAAPGAAQGDTDADVRVALSAKAVSLGEPFHLFVSVAHGPAAELRIPAVLDFGADVEVLKVGSSEGQARDGRPVRVFDVELMAFIPGELQLRPVPITVISGGVETTVQSAPLSLGVAGVIAEDSPSLRGASAPVSVYRTDQRWLIGGLAALSFLVFIVLLRIGMRRGRARASIREARLAELSPAADALAKLQEVEASGVIDGADRRPVYVALSEIARAYIGRSLDFAALDLTTSEISAELSRLGESEVAGTLVPWLEDADLVKFAGFRASSDDARQALYDLRAWIQRRAQVSEESAVA